MRWVYILVLSLLWTLPVHAADVYKQVSSEEMAGVLSQMGIEAEEIKDNTFKFKLNDFNVVLFNKGNNAQLYFGVKSESSTAQMNEWNREHRYSRAYIDGDGDPVLESDIDFDGGVTKQALVEFVKTYELSLKAFIELLKE